MIATEMPAAIRPYSMAVAPESSFKNFAMMVMCSPGLSCAGRCTCRLVEELLCVSLKLNLNRLRSRLALAPLITALRAGEEADRSLHCHRPRNTLGAKKGFLLLLARKTVFS
jgi:hypothetical protein